MICHPQSFVNQNEGCTGSNLNNMSTGLAAIPSETCMYSLQSAPLEYWSITTCITMLYLNSGFLSTSSQHLI